MKTIKKLLPGITLAFLLAVMSRFIESLMPIHLLGASVIALFLGMVLNRLVVNQIHFKAGLTFTSKRLLKFAIILLGASLNLTIVFNVGQVSLIVMVFTLLTCFGGGYFIGKILGLNWKLSNLISAGTGICGGSAIAAIAPVVDAEDGDIAYAMSATFLFDIAMILAFPLMGKALGLSDIAYGLWTGTAVNDTSSVVAASYAFSQAAGDFAVMVKLTRTLAIVPTVIIFTLIAARINQKSNVASKQVNLFQLFPWFILGFLMLTALNSGGFISQQISVLLKDMSKFIMIASLGAIGLNTNFTQMRKSGIKPMLHGFIISVLVVIVAIVVQYFIGII